MSAASAADPRIEPILRRRAEMVAQGGPLIVPMEKPALLQDRDDTVDKGVDPVLVNVGRYPEPVCGARLEPLLHVIGRLDRRPGDHRVIVDDTMGQHIPQAPSFTGNLEGIR